jgi:hypothetical protein
MIQIEEILRSFEPISLDQMDNVKLMNRADRKFAFHKIHLPSILQKAGQDYKVLTINGKKNFNYSTTYFDTCDWDMYADHQKGKMNRVKIRQREYIDTNASFLEIKIKSNKGKTNKKRISICSGVYCEKEKDFVAKHTPYVFDKLVPKLNNSFSRITLVDNHETERVTIDADIHYRTLDNREYSYPELVVLEIKKDRTTGQSKMVKILKDKRIRELGFSKYSIGSVLLYAALKNNSFKETIRTINKICHERSFANHLSGI